MAMSELPSAREIVLRKKNPMAPPFHRHIAKSKLTGKTCKAGDHVVIYDIISTDPPGEVMVTGETVFRFE
jgi:hypothetical protein